MTPASASLTLHASTLLARRRFGFVLWRLFFDFVAATALLRPLAAAGEWLNQDPFSASAWCGALALVLVGGACYFLVHVCVRAGTFRVAYAAFCDRPAGNIFAEGASVFDRGFSAIAFSALLDFLSFGSALLVLGIGSQVAALGTWATAAMAFSGAVFLSIAIALSGITTVAFALASIDDCSFAEAFARLRAVAVLERASLRAVSVAIVIWLLSVIVSATEIVSAWAAWQIDDPAGWTLFLPALSAFYAVIVDAGCALLVAALTDRLPVGMAAPLRFEGSITA